MEKLGKIFIGINGIALLGALFLFFYTDMLATKKDLNDKKEFMWFIKKAMQGDKTKELAIDKVIANLPSRSNRLRFISVEAYMVPMNKKDTPYLKEYKPLIRDIFIEVAGKTDHQDLNQVTGKIMFADSLRTEINKLFNRPRVREVLFTNFVIQ